MGLAGIIGFGIGVAGGCLLLLVFVSCCCCHKKNRKDDQLKDKKPKVPRLHLVGSCRSVTVEESTGGKSSISTPGMGSSGGAGSGDKTQLVLEHEA